MQLNDTVTSTSITSAATPNSVKVAYDYANYIYNTLVHDRDLTWNSSTDTYSRSISVLNNYVESDIHRNIKRCVLKDDGTVAYYLNSANSQLTADGANSNLSGSDGQVMVEIPKFYYKYSYSGNSHTWKISTFLDSGYIVHPAFIKSGVEVSYRYVGAYDACVYNKTTAAYESGTNFNDNMSPNTTGKGWVPANTILSSVSGIYPAVGLRRSDARTMASNRGTGWTQMDFPLYSAIQMLYLLEYGTFRSQSVLGDGNVNVGYPQYSTVQTDSPHSKSGKSDTYGNASANVYSTTRDVAWMSYRGIENLYGNCQTFVDGIAIDSNRIVYASNNNTINTFSDTSTANCTQIPGSSGLPSTPGFESSIYSIGTSFLPNSTGGGNSSSYISDYLQINTTTSNYYTFLSGGGAAFGQYAGVFGITLGDALGKGQNIGARLVY